MEGKIILWKEKIFWKKHPLNSRYFYFEDDKKIILLRINDFPDEPLYTLIDGLDISDIEDKPDGWVLEGI